MVSKKRKWLIIVFAYAVLILTSAVSIAPVKEVKALGIPRATIRFEPSDITVGVLGQDLPTPLTTINVTVANVTNLYAWQLKIYVDQSTISFGVNAAVDPDPSINIFGARSHFFAPPFVYVDAGTGNRYLKVGSVLQAPETGVNGSGVLTQLNFQGVSSGSSYLRFSSYGEPPADTFMFNITEAGDQWTKGNYRPIAADLFDGNINVLGNGISLSVAPELLEIGASVNITGLIFPRQETSVTIFYAPAPANATLDDWTKLASSDWKELLQTQTARININETYYLTGFATTWKPDKEGLYFLKAEGGGYVSQVKAITVKASSVAPPPNPWTLYGPAAAIVAVAVSSSFVWDRRRRRSGRMILP